MTLREWLEAESGRNKALAEFFAVTPSAVTQWLDNGIPRHRMIQIRDYTKGKVTLEDMLNGNQPRAVA